jgi:membrane protease YdiL (CAAX protease family)
LNRSSEFIRSFFPEDLGQLFFLFGVVSLYISPLLPWTSLTISIPVLGPLGAIWLASYGIQFSGAAGYFVCLRPGRRSGRQVFCWICLPAFIGLLVRCSLQIYGVTTLASSAFQNYGTWLSKVSLAIGLSIGAITGLGSGFHFALIGLVLVGVYLVRNRDGSTSLPLSLSKSSVSATDDARSWSRWQILTWILLVWIFFDWGVLAAISLLRNLRATAGLLSHPWLAEVFAYTISFSIFIGIAVWIVGKEVWTDLRRSLQLPLPESFLLAIAFPVGAVFLGSLAHYIFDLSWSAVSAHQGSPHAQFTSYFGFPNAALVCSLLIPVFFEEAVFRGFLQARFVRRYGQVRGVFLGSIVWAGWHFSVDFSRIVSDSGVLQQLSVRMTLCVGMGLVLGWLTMRTESILPATVAHAIYDALVRLPLRERGLGQRLSINLSWCLLAYVLFRYWGPGQQVKSQEGVPHPL